MKRFLFEAGQNLDVEKMLAVGMILIRPDNFRDPVTRTGISGGQFAHCSWHPRTVLEIAKEPGQARRLLGGESEWRAARRGYCHYLLTPCIVQMSQSGWIRD
jgi:hypothetical protein